MYKGTIKISTIIFSALVILFTSCSNKDVNKSKNAAKNLYALAEKEYNDSNYSKSIKLIDSLRKTYPKEIEIQNKAIHLLSLNNEKLAVQNMIDNDLKNSNATYIIEDLKPYFKYIKTENMVEGHKIDKSITTDPNKTHIEVKIDDFNNIFIDSYVVGKNISHDQISVSDGNTTIASCKIPYDEATNYHFKDNGITHEIVTFRGVEIDSLCSFIKENKSSKLKINFIGDKTIVQNLSDKEKNAIARTFDYARALKVAQETKEKEVYYKNKSRLAKEHTEKTKL